MPFRAVEEFAVRQIAFAWRARVSMAPLLWMAVEDAYQDGAGWLEGRVWGRKRAFRHAGEQMNDSERLRYLAEIFWVPHAITSNAERVRTSRRRAALRSRRKNRNTAPGKGASTAATIVTTKAAGIFESRTLGRNITASHRGDDPRLRAYYPPKKAATGEPLAPRLDCGLLQCRHDGFEERAMGRMAEVQVSTK